MPYTPELKELIKVVEKTRPERVERKKRGEEVPFLDLDQRKERLRYHPDFKEEGRRAIAVGPSKGYKIAHEFADLLASRQKLVRANNLRKGLTAIERQKGISGGEISSNERGFLNRIAEIRHHILGRLRPYGILIYLGSNENMIALWSDGFNKERLNQERRMRRPRPRVRRGRLLGIPGTSFTSFETFSRSEPVMLSRTERFKAVNNT